jgi:hypothetical protein
MENNRIMTFQELLEYRSRKQNDEILKGKVTADLFGEKLIFYNNNTKLLEADLDVSTINIKPNLSETEETVLLNAIDRTGSRTPYRCEFYPSASSQNSTNFSKYGVKYANIDQNFADNPNFSTFRDWFNGLLNNRIIVPDTCILQNHYLSKVLLPRIQDTLKIRIPRTVILELESKGNLEPKNKPVIFSTFNEIRKLQLQYHAQNFPDPIRGEFQANFSKIIGAGGGDRFIRLEIWDYLKLFSGGMRSLNTDEEMILLTKDMMMASAASAEGLDTFYLCPAQPKKSYKLTNLNQLVTELAIGFSKIRIEGLFKEYDVCCEGIWSGKDIMDWGLDRLRICSSTPGEPR